MINTPENTAMTERPASNLIGMAPAIGTRFTHDYGSGTLHNYVVIPIEETQARTCFAVYPIPYKDSEGRQKVHVMPLRRGMIDDPTMGRQVQSAHYAMHKESDNCFFARKEEKL